MEEEIIELAHYLNKAVLARVIKRLQRILNTLETQEELKKRVHTFSNNKDDE